MKRLARVVVTALAVSAAAAGTVLIPAAGAHADAPLPCPQIRVVCVWSDPGGQGGFRLLSGPLAQLFPPALSVQNQTLEPWCFYDGPGFSGPRREIAPFETVRYLEFPAHSARPGACDEY